MHRKKKLRFRLLRGGVLVFVLAGLFLFNLRWNRREPTLIRIGDITPVMNFSTVRVKGTLKSDARTLRSGAIFYLITDSIGTHGRLWSGVQSVGVSGGFQGAS